MGGSPFFSSLPFFPPMNKRFSQPVPCAGSFENLNKVVRALLIMAHQPLTSAECRALGVCDQHLLQLIGAHFNQKGKDRVYRWIGVYRS